MGGASKMSRPCFSGGGLEYSESSESSESSENSENSPLTAHSSPLTAHSSPFATPRNAHCSQLTALSLLYEPSSF